VLRVERRVLSGTPTDVVSLPYDQRKKSRLRVVSEQGREVAIVLERGSCLREGDLLAADSGEVILVRAAGEEVSEVVSPDALLLTRAAYHLGNRHVPLQIEAGALRYQHDHVLDGMLTELGVTVTVRIAAFQPEGGAYSGGGGHAHGHGEEHVHGHVRLPARERSGI
jgi:urease accessory protein